MKKLFLLFLLLTAPSLLRALPLEYEASPNNRLIGRTTHWHGRVYVSGTVKSTLPGLRAPGSYVEVDLLNAEGQVLGQARDQIGRTTRHPVLPDSDATHYTVSFPDALAAQAVGARVLFHNHAPGACPRKG